MILIYGGTKGGSGKSTMAINMAQIRAAQGRDVLLIDTDNETRSASIWAAARRSYKTQPTIACTSLFGDTLAAEVNDLANRYQDIIIDAGGSDSKELRSAMTVADKLITPLQPSQFDISTVFGMDSLVAMVMPFNPKLRAFISINRAPTNAKSSEVAETRELLKDLAHYKFFATDLCDRAVYRRNARDGQGVSEYKGANRDVKAANEMQSLYEEVWS